MIRDGGVDGMKVTWHGHACFSITRSDGYTVVFDPHDGHSIGLTRPGVKGDLILVTHDHFDHNAVDIVKKDGSRVLKSFRGETSVDDIVVKGYKTYHDKYGGRRRGENTVYIVSIEGLRIAHLGDLGHIPGDELLSKLSGVDILFIPVGGVYTIDADEAWEIVSRVKPVITVPMHYWVKGLTLPLHSVEDFLSYVKKFRVVRHEENWFEVGKSSLPSENSVYVLRYL